MVVVGEFRGEAVPVYICPAHGLVAFRVPDSMRDEGGDIRDWDAFDELSEWAGKLADEVLKGVSGAAA